MKRKTYISLMTLFLMVIISSEWADNKFKQGYSLFTNIEYFFKNTFNQSKFETKNFIIDLPKAYWIVDNNSSHSYYGSMVINSGNSSYIPIIDIVEFRENENAKWFFMELCRRMNSIIKQQANQKINNFEVEVYDCIDNNSVWKKIYLYNNEYFQLMPYFEKFKSQYDKFFDGVWLKE